MQVVPGNTHSGDVHQAMVRDTEVICQALYSVANHRVPPPDTVSDTTTAPPPPSVCPSSVAGVPVVPAGTAVVLVLDHSGSMSLPACPSCDPKQTILTEAIEVLRPYYTANPAGHADLWLESHATLATVQQRLGRCAAATATAARTREIAGWKTYSVALQKVEDGCGQ